jgi:peptide chain release factor 3
MDMAKTLHLYLLATLVPFVTAFEAPCIRCTGASRAAVPQLILTLKEEVDRRRNLAIISHPDAGKTTLTEKLLLYGGAIQSAGAVKAKGEQRRATSDFMAIEQERGISISTSVLTYEYSGKHVSILDTPGHQDFSEDTYRTLAAADNAVMLIDAAKGLEPQTRKLFEVARLRRLPLFTFVNKLDRPARTPYDICGEIEAEFGITCCPVVWPIGSGDRFRGVLDRRSKKVMLFERGERGKRLLEVAKHVGRALRLLLQQVHVEQQEAELERQELVDGLDVGKHVLEQRAALGELLELVVEDGHVVRGQRRVGFADHVAIAFLHARRRVLEPFLELL